MQMLNGSKFARTFIIGAGLICSSMAQAADTIAAPLPVAQDFALGKLVGDWFQIARYEESTLSNIVKYGTRDATASFALKPEAINELHATFSTTRFGKDSVEGALFAVNPADPPRLVLRSFLPPYSYLYFAVLELDEEQGFLLLGDDARENVYLYAKEANLPAETLRGIVNRLREVYGYENIEAQLKCTTQSYGDSKVCESILQH